MAHHGQPMEIPSRFSHGDHGRLKAVIYVSPVLRFSGATGTVATVVVTCSVCSWNARASQTRNATRSDPEARFTERASLRLLTQALNNFSDKAPMSCGEALAAVIIGS